MNQKLAKRLRKAAREHTADLKDHQFVIQRQQIVNDTDTTRGLYLSLKREAVKIKQAFTG